MKQNMNRSQLLNWINEVSFAVTEITLYLDTHPNDDEAFAFFNHYNEERRKAVSRYSADYAPLSLDTAPADEDYWRWAGEPWPWEGGSC